MADSTEVRDRAALITFGGRQYTLRYDFNAWADLEEHYGSMEAAMNALDKARDLSGKPATELRFFLWVGMSQDNPELTLKEVGRMITLDNLESLSRAVMEAVSGSLGDSPAGE